MKLKPTVDALTRFALACSGANKKILEDDCITEQSKHAMIGEQSKYAMIGMFIFLTSAFATLSSGYALYLGFKSAWLAAAIGVLWGLFIFNIDRFIISTIRKKQIDPDLPLIKKCGLGLWEIGKAFPRLLLAVLISIVISTPLEMKYFEPEIETRIDDRLTKERVEEQKKPFRDQSDDVTRRENENQTLQQQIDERIKRREQLRDQLNDEARGRRSPYGYGPVARRFEEQLKKYEEDLNAFIDQAQTQIGANKKVIDELRAKREEQVADRTGRQDKKKYSFLNSLIALNELASEFASIWWAEKFIAFLVLVLECTPILMKILASYGPYDSVLEAEEYAVTLKQRRYISDLNRKANHEEFFNTRKDSATLTVEEQLIRDAMSNLVNLVQPEIDRATVKAAQKVVNDFETEFTSSNYSRN